MKQYAICQKCGHASFDQEIRECPICAASGEEMLFDHLESDFTAEFFGKISEIRSTVYTSYKGNIIIKTDQSR